jgi:hemolysin III
MASDVDLDKVVRTKGAERTRQPAWRLREPVNGLTHLAGALLAVVVLVTLLRLASDVGGPQRVIAYGIFGLSLIALYTASALYHLLPLAPAGLDRLLRLDCTMVFVLIAGSYTPFCLVALHGSWRWGLLGAIWALSLGGAALKLRWMDAPRWLSTACYVLLGWVAVLAAPALFAALPARGMIWVIAGGVIYSVGALIFALERPTLRPRVFGAHTVWHLCVLAGSACHVWAVAHYLTLLR